MTAAIHPTKPRRISQQQRIARWVSAVLLAVLWLSGWLVTRTLSQQQEDLLSAQQFGTVRALAEELDHRIDDLQRNLYATAAFITDRHLDHPEQLQDYLREHGRLLDGFDAGTIVVSLQSYAIADHPPEIGRRGQFLGDRDYVIQTFLRGRSVIGRPYAARNSSDVIVPITAPIVDSLGTVTAVLAGFVRLGPSRRLAPSIFKKYGESGGFLLMSPRDEVFVAATDPERILQPLPRPGANPMNDRYRAGFDGSGVAVSSRGVEELSSAMHIPATGWYLVAVLPTDEAFAPIHNLRLTLLIGTALFSLFLWLLVRYLIRCAFTPLEDVIDRIQGMSTGEAPLEPIPARGADEIGRLAASFNRLTAKISWHQAELESARQNLENALATARMRFWNWSTTPFAPGKEAGAELIHADHRERVFAEMAAVIGSDQPFLVEFPGESTSDPHWFMARGRIWPADERSPPRLMAIVWDISERHRAEAALRESDERFRTIAEAAMDAIIQIDDEGIVRYWNSVAERMFGHTASEAIGKDMHDLIAPRELNPRIRPGLVAFRQSGDGAIVRRIVEFEAQCSDGRRIPVELSVSPVRVRGRWGAVGVVRDISARRQAEAQTRKHLAQLAEAERLGQLGSWEWEVNARTLRWSDELYRLLGLATQAEAMTFARFLEFVHADDRARIRETYSRVLGEGRRTADLEYRVRRTDGAERIVQSRFESHRDADGKLARVVGIVRDVTEQRQNERLLELAFKVFEGSHEGITITDAELRILMVNTAFTRITGYPAEAVVGQTPRLLKSGLHDEIFYREMWQEIVAEGSWKGEIWNRRASGDIYPEWLSIAAVYDSAGVVTNYIGNFADISERKDFEAKIERLSHLDVLTGLPNRALLLDRLQVAVAVARRRGAQLAVLLVDIDRFKNINDSLGFAAGDEVLKQAAQRLGEVVRASDTVSRLSGDDFAIVCVDIETPGDAAIAAGKVIRCFDSPFRVGEQEVAMTPSIGIALYPSDGELPGDLLRNSEVAKYLAKDRGRNCFQFFTASTGNRAFEMLLLENSLRRALERNELTLYYQPQVDLADGRTIGFEALIRWQHPQRALVSPAEFIPLAEETGLIIPIGAWVIEEACRQLRQWQDEGLGGLHVAVNMSAVQFRQSGLVGSIESVLRKTGVDPRLLEIEVTESAIMHDAESVITTLARLKALGVRLSIDDFGTGYSSLAYLKRFPIDVLKIDRSFVNDIGNDRNADAICFSIVMLARSLGLKTVGEGVETPVQREFLRTAGCDFAQGYFYSRPLPAREIRAAQLFGT